MTTWWTISYKETAGGPLKPTMISAPDSQTAWERWSARREQLKLDHPEAWFDYHTAVAHEDRR